LQHWASGNKEEAKNGFFTHHHRGIHQWFLIATDAPTVSRIVVFPLFMAGFVSLLQAARKVCVYHAWKKTKNMN